MTKGHLTRMTVSFFKTALTPVVQCGAASLFLAAGFALAFPARLCVRNIAFSANTRRARGMPTVRSRPAGLKVAVITKESLLILNEKGKMFDPEWTNVARPDRFCPGLIPCERPQRLANSLLVLSGSEGKNGDLAQSTSRYLINAHAAAIPSFHVIFLPSEKSRP